MHRLVDFFDVFKDQQSTKFYDIPKNQQNFAHFFALAYPRSGWNKR